MKTEEGEWTVESVETLKEIVKVKIVEKDDTKIKKFNVKDIKVIRDAEVEEEANIDESDLKELKKLEELDKKDMNN